MPETVNATDRELESEQTSIPTTRFSACRPQQNRHNDDAPNHQRDDNPSQNLLNGFHLPDSMAECRGKSQPRPIHIAGKEITASIEEKHGRADFV